MTNAIARQGDPPEVLHDATRDAPLADRTSRLGVLHLAGSRLPRGRPPRVPPRRQGDGDRGDDGHKEEHHGREGGHCRAKIFKRATRQIERKRETCKRQSGQRLIDGNLTRARVETGLRFRRRPPLGGRRRRCLDGRRGQRRLDLC